MLLGLGLLLGAGACDKPPAPDPLDPGGDRTIYRSVQCVSPQPDGSCNKLSCKKDSKSDCAAFVKACLKNKNTADGTSNEATCTRGTSAPPTPQ
jgi:hypothetical protein